MSGWKEYGPTFDLIVFFFYAPQSRKTDIIIATTVSLLQCLSLASFFVMAADPSSHLPIVTFPMQQGLGIAVQVSGRVVAPHALLLVV